MRDVAIIGVGLLGGSLGLALKARGMASTVRGVGHRAASLEQAKAVGAIDTAHVALGEAVHDAALVVIATPQRPVARA